MYRLLPLLLGALALVACAVPTRRDDVHEPNDRPSQATFLRPGRGLELRANQGNPDVFAVEVPGTGDLTLLLASRGLENCASLRLDGPDGEILFQDALDDCARGSVRRVLTPGVSFGSRARSRSFGGEVGTTYSLTLEEARPGRYHLTVIEQGGRLAPPRSWDYAVRVRFD